MILTYEANDIHKAINVFSEHLSLLLDGTYKAEGHSEELHLLSEFIKSITILKTGQRKLPNQWTTEI